ncbi:DUF6266 family protein [Mariniflexile litorale]|uniref:DUF6266 family protein n=1 Tax=Mariniflexile litorale TaxID=3045158 RepID=A0AAU7EDU5_9FLAO|nr:DUF6266 family protein [Mariniflexile sp. KMM 9835]MDQ8212347.1 DUF6266 family protein [Mariniflexile sp. KMM 9835]
METYNNGVLGDFSGQVGPVIGSHWRGINVLQAIPNKISKALRSADQLERDKFKFMLQFLSPIKGLLTETFSATGNKTPFDNAMSYHLKEAVSYTGTAFEIDYSKVLIGMGGLSGIAHSMVHGAGTTALTLAWLNNSQQGLAYPTDALLVVAYAPRLNDFDFFMAYNMREAGTSALDFMEIFHGETVHLWATFTNIDLALTATSRYLGSYVV